MEDHASMAPLAVRRTYKLVGLAQRSIAHELIVAAQAVDMRGCHPLGRGTALAYETVREHVPMPRDVGSWEADVEGLVAAVARGELGGHVATGAGVRQELSEHQGPGLLSESALNELEEVAGAGAYGQLSAAGSAGGDDEEPDGPVRGLPP